MSERVWKLGDKAFEAPNCKQQILKLMKEDRPVFYFFFMACLFSWAAWIPLILSRQGLIPLELPMPLYFVGAFGPMVAALLASRKFGISSPKELLASLLQLRMPVKWYLWALGIPVLLYAAGALVTIGLSDTPEVFQFNSPVSIVSIFFSMCFVVVGEELGWRGFALPYLQNRYTAFHSTVWVWLMWGIWHFPAFLVSGIFDTPLKLFGAFAGFLILLFPFSILFTWLYNSSNGKVILAVILHASVAAASGMANVAVKEPIVFFSAFTGFFLIAGLMILRIYKKENLAHTERTRI